MYVSENIRSLFFEKYLDRFVIWSNALIVIFHLNLVSSYLLKIFHVYVTNRMY